ncbi:MAG: acylphosphatase [Candidatus Diapherotrites archaeon]|nr:acylphosphatase [Candidatus Diapherotrites archaeon]
MTRERLIVRGNIQGVGYRALVKQAARSLGIRGLVRNLNDGTVEIFCEGAKKQLEGFEKSINLKPGNGLFSTSVDKIEAYPEGNKNYINAPIEFKIFEIDYGMEAATPFEKANLERLEIGILVMSEFKDETRQSFDRLDKKYDKMSNGLSETKDALADKLSETKDALSDKLSETKDALGGKMDGVSGKLEETKDVLSDKLSEVSGEISKGFANTQTGLKKEISEGFANTQKVFKNEFSKFRESNEMLAKSLIKAVKR